MLAPALLTQLTELLTKVTEPIELVSRLDDSATATEMGELLDEIAGASESVTHVRGRSEAAGDARVPSFVIRRAGTDVEVEFAGLPMGHEFTSLVLALLQVGGHAPKITPEQAEAIRGIEGTHHFETFFSQSCQNCPDVVQALNVMAVLNPGITHTAVDGAVFPQEATDRGVLAVPTVFVDGETFGSGRMTLDEIIGKLDTGAAARAAEQLDAAEQFEVLVIGGGPAGASAALYTARKGIRTGIVAERFGGQLLDTMAIENYPSVQHTEGPRMAADLEAQVRSYGVEVVTGQQVEHVHPAEGDEPIRVELASGATLRTRSLVIATGARWRTMGVPGEEDYRTKGVTFCPHCDGPLFTGKRVAVIGGGNSGVEAAIDLAGIVGHVTLLEFDEQLRADAVLQAKAASLPNVEIVTRAATTQVRGDGAKVVGLDYTDLRADAHHELDVEGVFVQIGLLPGTEFLSGTLEMNERHEIVVDDHGRTSVPGVFAAGDCTTTPFKQITVASGAGATAALSAFDHLIRSDVAETAQRS
ncbi:MAG: alkyl hydroperoxide reductase subunit F [Micrococcales bacterium]|nr:alkyl hydroperoxide reductase subunit F [Micrococcales bacterium]